jgi:hypothetical protein
MVPTSTGLTPCALGLAGYEVLMAELVPAKDIERGLPIGARYSIENGDLLVWGRRGETGSIHSLDNKRLGDVRFGEPVRNVGLNAHLHTSGDETERSTHLNVSVPEDFGKAEVAVLLELNGRRPHEKVPTFKMVVNGVSRDAAVEGGDGTWFWVTSDLEKGRNRIECSIRFAEKEKGKVSFWLMGDRQLFSQKVGRIAGGEDRIVPAKPYPASIEKVFIPLSHFGIQ